MKKIIFAAFLFLNYISFAQGGPKVDVIKFRGEVTTTIRNTFDVPVGENWVIYNTTTGQYEESGSDDVWEEFGVSYTFGTGLTESGGTVTVDFGAAGFGNYISRINAVNVAAPSSGDSWEIRHDFTGTSRGSLLLDNGSAAIRSENPQTGAYGQFFASVGLANFTRSDGATSTVWDFDSAYDSNDDIARKVNVDAAISAANQTLSLTGTDLSISDGNTVDLSGLGGGLADVRPDDIVKDNVWTLGRFLTTDGGNLFRWSFPSAVYTTITDTGGNFTATNVEGALAELATSVSSGLTSDQLLELSNRGQSKDSLITAAVDSLALDLATWQAGSDKYKTKVIRKNNGRLDLFPPSNFASIPNGTLWRGFTAATNDTIAIPSANGVVVRFEGQSTSNAGYVTGEWGEFWAKKISNDTLRISSPNMVGYTYTPPVTEYSPNNLYVEASAVNADNDTASLGTWERQTPGQQVTLSVQADAPVVALGSTRSIEQNKTDTSTFERLVYPYSGLTAGQPVTIRFYWRVLSGGAGGFRVEGRDGGSLVTVSTSTTDTGWSASAFEYTFTPTNTSGQIRFYGNWNNAGTYQFRITNFELLQ